MNPPLRDWPSGRLVDEVAELIRERIMQARYAPGAPLSQRRLADELSVGRAIVGEALRVLEREGLVTVAPPGRGIRVAADDGFLLLAAYAVREMVDGLAARLAAHRAGPALDGLLRAAIGELRAGIRDDDRRRCARANVAFHSTIIEAAGNPLLLGQVALVRGTARSAAVVDRDRLEQVADEHEAIVHAISDRGPDDAERLAREHVRATVAALEHIPTAGRAVSDVR